MNKPNGNVPQLDPSLAIPATFVNDFRFTMNEQVARLTFIEGDGQQGHIRNAVVLPIQVAMDLAQKLLDSYGRVQARAKIIMPQAGANEP